MSSADLDEKLKTLPEAPGVYLMKDRVGRIIYVGKSASLKSRVRSYFQPSSDHTAKIRWLVSKIVDFETIVVNSEIESLILECNLIKRHRPYFNMKYRDDKRYPMLEVSTGDTYPKLRVVRRPHSSRHRYFGPFPDAGALRRTIKILQKVFRIRTCHQDMNKKLQRPCLDYYIGLCTAPCTRFVSPQEYRQQVDLALEFLEGHSERLLRRLREEMTREAELLNFERCARIRDMLADLERTAEKQKVVLTGAEDEDYLAVASERDLVCAQVLQVREGKLVGHRFFLLESPGGSEPSEQIAGFIKTYYLENSFIPQRVHCCVLPEEKELLQEWLSGLGGRRTEIRVPQRGEKRELMQIAEKNANQQLDQEKLRPSRGAESRRLALEELQTALGLSEPPWRMECVDISNFQGRQAVGSLTVFEQGQSRPDQYRRFRIRSGDTPDDFRMMREVLSRRFHRPADDAGEERRAFESLPDLLIVDGGKGQLGVAVEVLQELGLSQQVALAGLAKENEWLFVPGDKEPVILAPTSRALLMVTHMRDETHRFAIQYHRQVRKVAFKQSALDDAPGIGQGRKQSLLKHFGSLKRLAQASLPELEGVPGLGPKLARQLHDYLHGGVAQ